MHLTIYSKQYYLMTTCWCRVTMVWVTYYTAIRMSFILAFFV